jgi:hypothetical protein
MKMNTLRGLLVGVGALLLFGSPVSALVKEPIDVDIPFDFVVDHKPLPAGRYIVEPVDTSNEGSTVIKSADGRNEAVFVTEELLRRKPATETELVFDEVGGTYRLCQIATAGSAESDVLQKSADEREADQTRSRDHGHRMVGAVTVEVGSRQPTS